MLKSLISWRWLTTNILFFGSDCSKLRVQPLRWKWFLAVRKLYTFQKNVSRSHSQRIISNPWWNPCFLDTECRQIFRFLDQMIPSCLSCRHTHTALFLGLFCGREFLSGRPLFSFFQYGFVHFRLRAELLFQETNIRWFSQLSGSSPKLFFVWCHEFCCFRTNSKERPLGPSEQTSRTHQDLVTSWWEKWG